MASHPIALALGTVFVLSLALYLGLSGAPAAASCHQRIGPPPENESSAEQLDLDPDFGIEAACGLSNVEATKLDLDRFSDVQLSLLGVQKAVRFHELSERVVNVCFSGLDILVFIDDSELKIAPRPMRQWIEREWDKGGDTGAEWEFVQKTCAEVQEPGIIVQLSKEPYSFLKRLQLFYAEPQIFDFINISPEWLFGILGGLVAFVVWLHRSEVYRDLLQHIGTSNPLDTKGIFRFIATARAVFAFCFDLDPDKRKKMLAYVLTGISIGSFFLGHMVTSSLNNEADSERSTSREVRDCVLVVVGERGINIREEPGLTGDILRTVDFGTELTQVTARTKHWFEVRYEGITGWVNSEWVVPWGECDEQ